MDDTRSNNVAGDQLRAFIERVERLDEEIKGLNDDKSDLFKEAKGSGFCTKTIKKIISLRKKDPAVLSEEEAMLEMYLSAIGTLD